MARDPTQDDLDAVLEDITEYVDHALNEAQSPQKNWLQRQLELHPSSFPYCPLRHMFGALQQKPQAFGMSTFAGSYFTGVGILVHELIQRFMAVGGRVWGHWKCEHHDSGKCKYIDLSDISPYHNCPVCGSRCEYEEVGYNEDGVLVGHQDCMYEDKNGVFWVLDYKTTMLIKAQKHAKDGETLAKNAGYRAQQRTYVTLAHRKYGKTRGIKPKGWILVYLPRDNPFNYQLVGEVVTLQEKKDVWKQIKYDMEALTTVLDATSFEEIEPLIDRKPCESLEYYKEHIHDQYNPCPLTAVCFNGRLGSTLKNEMDGHVLLPLRVQYQKAIRMQEKRMKEVTAAQSLELGDEDD